MTLPDIILATLRDSGQWTFGYNLEKVETKYGWIGSSGMVRCRELERAGKIEKRGEGRYIQYRYKEPEIITEEMLTDMFGEGGKEEVKEAFRDPTQLSVFTKV